MATVVEQLTPDGKLTHGESESFSSLKQAVDCFKQFIPEEQLCIETIEGHKCIVFINGDCKIVLLHGSITYLGNPHPHFKKRVQLKEWWQTLCKNHPDLDVRFIGVYTYKSVILFAEFVSDTYLKHGLHNSSAHVFTNDLYQALKNGSFSKTDAQGNKILFFNGISFYKHLCGELSIDDQYVRLFDSINSTIAFNEWFTAEKAISELIAADDNNMRQTEWPAFYTEYKYKSAIKNLNLSEQIVFTGSSNKKQGDIDLDLYFPLMKIFGELKTTDIESGEIPGNDIEGTEKAIKEYGRYWLVVYSIEVIKDIERGSEMARKRMELLGLPPKDPPSYANLMKHSVQYISNSVYEINEINLDNMTRLFKQGHQPSGKSRKPKTSYIKDYLENAIIYRYIIPDNRNNNSLGRS